MRTPVEDARAAGQPRAGAGHPRIRHIIGGVAPATLGDPYVIFTVHDNKTYHVLRKKFVSIKVLQEACYDPRSCRRLHRTGALRARRERETWPTTIWRDHSRPPRLKS